jgi:phage-related protein
MTAPVLPLLGKITNESSKTSKNRILEAQFGNGYRQVAKDGINSTIDTWSLQFSPLYGTDLTTMQTFISTVGVTVWFTWTPLGESVSKKWRIDKDSIKTTLINTTKFIYSFSITQCFDLGT